MVIALQHLHASSKGLCLTNVCSVRLTTARGQVGARQAAAILPQSLLNTFTPDMKKSWLMGAEKHPRGYLANPLFYSILPEDI